MAKLGKKAVFTVHEAKTHLSKLLVRAEAGEEIVIARGSKPIAKLTAVKNQLAPRVPGRYKGMFEVGPEFFEPLPDDEMEAWE